MTLCIWCRHTQSNVIFHGSTSTVASPPVNHPTWCKWGKWVLSQVACTCGPLERSNNKLGVHFQTQSVYLVPTSQASGPRDTHDKPSANVGILAHVLQLYRQAEQAFQVMLLLFMLKQPLGEMIVASAWTCRNTNCQCWESFFQVEHSLK